MTGIQYSAALSRTMIHRLRPEEPDRFPAPLRSQGGSLIDAVAPVPEARTARYPFGSPYYDPLLHNGAYIQELLMRMKFHGRSTSLTFLQVREPIILRRELAAQGDERVVEELANAIGEDCSNIILGRLNGCYPLFITRKALVSLIEAAAIPPSIVETLYNTSGLLSSLRESKEDEDENFRLHIKVPFGPDINGAVYFHCSLQTQHYTAVILCSNLTRIENRLNELFEHDKHAAAGRRDPFLILAVFAAEWSYSLEDVRENLDDLVVACEERTGTTLLVHDERRNAHIDAYPPLFNRLHVARQRLDAFERIVKFHGKMVSFLKREHEALVERKSKNCDEAEENELVREAGKVDDSLDLTASAVENMREQVGGLIFRLQVQLDVVSTRLNQHNGRTNLWIAEETKRDSRAMKTIAALTMFFLPGTFVASLFSMTFFGLSESGSLSVSHHWWLYLAVTIPLTASVMLVWWLWIRWRDDGIQDLRTSGFHVAVGNGSASRSKEEVPTQVAQTPVLKAFRHREPFAL